MKPTTVLYTQGFEKSNYLAHHGILGQKWGIRRYQNADGSLTPAGKKRYAKQLANMSNKEELKEALRKELTTNPQVDLKALKDKYNAWMKSEEKIDDLMNSPEMKEADKKAYEETYNWFAKNEKEYLDDIIKRNNGSKENLDAFHDFRKLFEGWQDEEWQKAEKRYQKRTGYDPAENDRLFQEYHRESQKMMDTILGKSKDMLMKNIPETDLWGRPIHYTLGKYLDDVEFQYLHDK